MYGALSTSALPYVSTVVGEAIIKVQGVIDWNDIGITPKIDSYLGYRYS